MTRHILLPDYSIHRPRAFVPAFATVFRPPFDAGGFVLLDTFDALDPAWTWLLGTGAVVGGALRAATIVVDGYNFVLNPEFTTNTLGWTAGFSTIARVDFSAIPTGDIDNWGLRVINARPAPPSTGYAYYTLPAIKGITYVQSARAYAPSLNTALKAAAIGNGLNTAIVTAEDVWQTLTITFVEALTSDVFYCYARLCEIGDMAYFDSASFQQKVALAYHAGFAKVDGTFTAGVPMPAVATTPRSLAFRITDALNYWEVRVLPNTAGNDTFIIEHVAGVQTTRGTPADVDWTAGALDEIMVDVRGDDISVSHKKSGAGSWTAATSYLTMATGLASTWHGVDLYQTGVDQLTYWQAAA